MSLFHLKSIVYKIDAPIIPIPESNAQQRTPAIYPERLQIMLINTMYVVKLWVFIRGSSVQTTVCRRVKRWLALHYSLAGMIDSTPRL